MIIGVPRETHRHEHRVGLTPGAGVVTSRADVHYVVTEHGAANLFGKNLRERAEALIGIADPRFQEELARAAKERRLLP